MNRIVRIINSFRLLEEKEEYEMVIENVSKGVVFKGTNLWILIFAIFIASLGLNINSTAVIIGAMLISPLMGPIIGMGLSLGINDLGLLRKSIQNYLFAVIVGLGTSTIYFLLSPVNEAHSEILARTQPNMYDVLIAFFGGLAGIVAVSSKQKGNVLPGVAIATALMPPLCTAGYGLATLQWNYFGGAFYLFLINTVFIALSTLITARYLRFPINHLLDPKKEQRAKHIVWVITVLTILPSIYFGYSFIQDNRFIARANNFIEVESKLPDEYLLNKTIEASNRRVILTYGGAKITSEQMETLQQRFKAYNLSSNAVLEVKQGFSYLDQTSNNNITNNLLSAKDVLIVNLQNQIDTLTKYNTLGEGIYKELKVNYPEIDAVSLTRAEFHTDSTHSILPLCIISDSKNLPEESLFKINAWLKVRLGVDSIRVMVQK